MSGSLSPEQIVELRNLIDEIRKHVETEKPKLRPNVRSTEFWFYVLNTIIGVGLILSQHEITWEVLTMLMGMPSTYHGFRHRNKNAEVAGPRVLKYFERAKS